MLIRRALPEDSNAISAIYGHYIRHTEFTFDIEPVGSEDFSARILAAASNHAFIVAQDEKEILGYAFTSPYKSKRAYQWTAEIGIYLSADLLSRGTGKMLYGALLNLAQCQNYTTLLAGITTPNQRSEKLHAHFGFSPCFTLDNIGFKGGQWRQVIWWRKDFTSFDTPPVPIRALDSFSQEELKSCGLEY